MTDLRRERRVGLLLILPSLLIVALLALVPLVAVAWYSLHEHFPVFRIWRFVGFENYVVLGSDARFWRSLGNTVYITAASVALELLLGLGFALILHRRFRGRGWIRASVLVPWVLPTVVAAQLWRWILDPGFGVLNHLLGTPFNWLGEPGLALHTVIFIDVWKSTPFAAFLILAGRQMIPEELYEAATIDGAGSWRRCSRITLPLLAPTLSVVVLLRSLDAFRIFDIVFVLTGGGPANATETTSIYAYKLYFQESNYGAGAAVSMVTFIVMAIWSAIYVRALARQP